MEIAGLIRDQSDADYFKNDIEVVKQLINIFAKDSTSDSIKRSEKHSKAETSSLRSEAESITAYIERFLLLAHSFLNLTSSYRASAERQHLEMVLLFNSNLSQETSSLLMESFVSATNPSPTKRPQKS